MMRRLRNPLNLSEQMDELFDRAFFGLASARQDFEPRPWRPPVDVLELDDGILVIADLAGVDDRDLEVTVQDGKLRIAGTKRPPNVAKSKGPIQLEIQYGPFERILALPRDADSERIEAHFRQGLLALHVPAATKRDSKTVRIKVGNDE